mmetsp:Transcript_13356/g.28325  ORF Transcript_13356/g.28325 Transcript_13356/m.28325 type:complete len:100 (-) Transcript_13356:462-761(-)
MTRPMTSTPPFELIALRCPADKDQSIELNNDSSDDEPPPPLSYHHFMLSKTNACSGTLDPLRHHLATNADGALVTAPAAALAAANMPHFLELSVSLQIK